MELLIFVDLWFVIGWERFLGLWLIRSVIEITSVIFRDVNLFFDLLICEVVGFLFNEFSSVIG